MAIWQRGVFVKKGTAEPTGAATICDAPDFVAYPWLESAEAIGGHVDHFDD